MSISFKAREGLILAQTILTGPSSSGIATHALDTGAITTVVDRRFFLDLGYDPSTASDQVQITTGSGVRFAPEIALIRIEALEHEHTNFPILCHTFPPSATVDGVLGLDFLRGKRLVLDFRAGLITLD